MRLICLLYMGLPPEVQNESFKCVGISHCMYRHSGHRMVLFSPDSAVACFQLVTGSLSLQVHHSYLLLCLGGKKQLIVCGFCVCCQWVSVVFCFGVVFCQTRSEQKQKNSKDADCKSLVYLVNSSIFLQSTKQRSLQHKWILQHNMDSTK